MDKSQMSADAADALAWVEKLHKRMVDRSRSLSKLSDYYIGKHDLRFAGERWRETFGIQFSQLSSNWCRLVVDACEERLNVEGFRFGDNQAGDKDAWRIWQANQLDADSQIAHTEALVSSVAYALVWPNPVDEATPTITVEHPSEMIVAYAAGSRRNRLAALKVWDDPDTKRTNATVYLPHGLYKFQSDRQADDMGLNGEAAHNWQPREVRGETWPAPNPLGVVPVVPLHNRPRLLTEGESEIAEVIPLQDGVNKLLADMIVASEYSSFRQRWATGIEMEENPDTGQLEAPPWKVAVDRMLVTEDAAARFGTFEASDLQNYVRAIEMIVQHVASQTRTPPHYFYLKGSFPSGESIKSAETGLVAKARRKMRHFGEGWEEVIRLAGAAGGNAALANAADAETIWGDPESRSESEHVDALVKLQSLGVPNRVLWEKAGFTPQEIDRMDGLAMESALLTAEGDAIPPAG